MIFDEMTTMRKLMLLHGVFDSKSIEEISTGNPLTFVTDLARPLKSLLIPFSPRQDGSGDPSPENIRSIAPWNGLKVFGGGKNLFDESQLVTTGITLSDGWYTGTRLSFYNAFGKDGNKFACPTFKENTQYTLKVTGKNSDSNGGWFVIRYVGGGTTTQLQITGTEEQTQSVTSTAGKTIERIDFTYPTAGSATFYVKNIQLEVGSTATAYEPYEPITETDIAFPSAVYGGTLDVVSGVLTVKPTTLVYDGSSDEDWKSNGENGYYIPAPVGVSDELVKLIANYMKGLEPGEGRFLTDWTCRLNLNVTNLLVKPDMAIVTTVTEWKEYLAENPLTVVFYLSTPQEITLTPEKITALLGDNTIWSDADGRMTAVYLKKG